MTAIQLLGDLLHTRIQGVAETVPEQVERQDRHQQDGEREDERPPHDHGRNAVGKNMTERDDQVTDAECGRYLYI